MVLLSSLEEGKMLKKRHAVFNFDGSLAELIKGSNSSGVVS
jgi:DNA polymerase epsilon subunit 1